MYFIVNYFGTEPTMSHVKFYCSFFKEFLLEENRFVVELSKQAWNASVLPTSIVV